MLQTVANALLRPTPHPSSSAADALIDEPPTPLATHRQVPRFTLSQPGQGEAMTRFLEEEGFAVVASALTAEEAARAMDLTWAYLESGGTGIDRADPTTWGDAQWPFGAIGGDAGIGHSQQLWYIRSCPGVKQAWATIYGTDDLITSYDGMSLFRPWTVEPNWRTDGPWYHTDQSPFPPEADPHFDPEAAVYGCERHYVQGFVNLLENSPLTGGNVVVPRSHKRFVEMLQQGVPRSKFTDRLLSRDVLSQGIVAHLQPGDLFLWDSRAAHGATPGSLAAASTADEAHGKELFRAAAYVCMVPTNRASQRVLKQRKEMLLSHQGTGAFCAAYNANTGRVKESRGPVSFQPILQDMSKLTEAQWQLVLGKARAASRSSGSSILEDKS